MPRSACSRLVEVLTGLPLPVVLPLHPRTEARLRSAGLHERLAQAPGVILTEPLGYFELTALLCHARAAITDSGGLQKEAYLARVPCITLRPNTEWTETVELGWNVLADLDLARVLAALERDTPAVAPPVYGDGHAGERVVAALASLV